MVSDFVGSDLTSLDDEELQAHLDRTNEVFEMLTNKTNGILTYYYRIDPSVSATVDRFRYVNPDGKEFLNQNAPTFSDSSLASFSVGYARAFLDSADTLRALIKKADVKMYEVKRSSKGES